MDAWYARFYGLGRSAVLMAWLRVERLELAWAARHPEQNAGFGGLLKEKTQAFLTRPIGTEGNEGNNGRVEMYPGPRFS